MIANLRARHRTTFAVLAVALPAAFALALYARDDERGVPELPASVASDGPVLGPALRTATLLHMGRTYTLRMGQQPSLVALEQQSESRAPDVLVYWCAGLPSGSELPSDAVLLGALGERERRFELPELASGPRGAIALYSLAYFELVAAFPLDVKP